jgi:hypothetical protein
MSCTCMHAGIAAAAAAAAAAAGTWQSQRTDVRVIALGSHRLSVVVWKPAALMVQRSRQVHTVGASSMISPVFSAAVILMIISIS